MNTQHSPTDVFGHPRGLACLCVAEGWERFSYFGMQSLLVLYMTHHLLQPAHVEAVVGFNAVRNMIESVTGPLSSAALASQIFGLYSGLVYLTPLLGGLLADRWGNRTATVTIGAIVMALGHFLMTFDSSFFLAMTFLLIGVGCFKGNIASQVGELYGPEDARRATAYQLFQLSISAAVMLAPLVCGTLGEKGSWHWGFAAAGIGMLIALAVYLHGQRWLPSPCEKESAFTKRGMQLSTQEWRRLAVLLALLPVLAAVMVGNQQMFNAFVVWGETTFELHFLGVEMPVTWLLSLDAMISAVCIALAIAFWRFYSRKYREPDDIVKIAIGSLFMAVAPLVLTLASLQHQASGAKVSPGWGLAFEVINEIGFAMVVPVALSLYSRTAPRQIQGLMIGVFYLSLFLCNVTVGRLGGLLEQMSAATFWLMHAVIVSSGAVVLMILAIWCRKLFSVEET